MKKILFTTVTASMGIMLFSNVAMAAVQTQNENTDMSIKFVSEDPNTDPDDPQGKYSKDLTFPWHPREFAFGERQANLAGATYNLNTPAKSKQYLVINDARTKDHKDYGKKWSLKASMSDLTEVQSAGATTAPIVIDNAELTFVFDNMKSYLIGTEIDPNNPTDILPANPNNDVEIGGQLVPSVQEYGTGQAPTTAPGDIAYLNQAAGTLSGESVVLSNKENTNQEATIMEQKELRDGTAADAREKEGYAARIKEAKISFSSLDTEVIDKKFSGKVNWVLSQDID